MRKPFLADYRLSQNFGGNPDLYKRFLVKQPDGTTAPLRGHSGLDWATPNDTPLVSPIAGKVIEATFDDAGYGYYLKIENDTEGCVIAHMRRLTVGVGFVLKEGDPIGTSDNTGFSTAPHVHMGYYTKPRDRSNGYAGFIDPLPFLTGISTEYQHTNEEYAAMEKDREKFWKERDTALVALDTVEKKYTDLASTYTAIAALGVNTVDDLQKERTNYEEKITILMREISQVRDRNAEIAKQIDKMETEESAALDEALACLKERDTLKVELNEVKKTVGASSKIDFMQFLDHLQTIYTIVADYFAKQKKPSDFSPGTLAPSIQSEKKDTFWKDFLKATGLGGIIGISIWVIVYFIH